MLSLQLDPLCRVFINATPSTGNMIEGPKVVNSGFASKILFSLHTTTLMLVMLHPPLPLVREAATRSRIEIFQQEYHVKIHYDLEQRLDLESYSIEPRHSPHLAALLGRCS